MDKQKVLDKLDPEKTSLYGLILVFLTAGVSKFVQTSLWIGFEPSFVANFVDSTTLVYLGGVFEITIAAGLMWCRTRKYFALTGFLWLSIITLQVVRFGLWDIAIRDIGLLFLALTVVAYTWR